MDDATKNGFITSINTNTHPLVKARMMQKTRLLYFAALESIVCSCAPDTEYLNARLSQYRDFLVGEETAISLTDENSTDIIKMLVNDSFMPWKRKYRYLLLCDAALIIPDKVDRDAVEKAYDMIKKHLSAVKQKKLHDLLEILYNDDAIPPVFECAENLITQFRENRIFAAQKEIRIMVTATISTGKSTLINALIGKPVTKTAVDSCTTNLCFLYNKPFEDDRFHLSESSINMNAAPEDLANAGKCSIASYFRTLVRPQFRICLIDTPGVNLAENQSSERVTLKAIKETRKAIREKKYDKLIYVLSPPTGGKDERDHLEYVYKNVPNEKIIFVLNQLDFENMKNDSITASINSAKSHLQNNGFNNPVIWPMSAKFSLWLKRTKSNEQLTKNEQELFNLNIKMFDKPEYDLSAHYDKAFVVDKPQRGDKLLDMCFVSGLYGLETILYGGTEK